MVTKPDRADPGTHDRLEATGADHLHLDLGYVAVCNNMCVVLTYVLNAVPCFG